MSSEPVWVVMTPESVPERWRGRVVSLSLIPLVGTEARELLNRHHLAADLSREEEEVARVAARGVSPDEIARELHVSKRTVYRRLAALRRAVGAMSATELTAELARRGFGGNGSSPPGSSSGGR